MTRFRKNLDTLKSYTSTHVTFGNGTKGKILGVGNLINHDLLELDNVLLVKDLTSNLISISQLCDQGMEVHFNKSKCQVINKK